MTGDDLKLFLKTKNYPNSLIDWAVQFYPVMVDYFGYEKTNNFFL